jgi:hypothetical protein
MKINIKIKENKNENKNKNNIILDPSLNSNIIKDKEREILYKNKNNNNKDLIIKNPEDNFFIENLFSFSYKNNLSYTESLVNINII